MKVEPKDLREGDRVRITLEGEVKSAHDPEWSIMLVGGEINTYFSAKELAHAEITRLEAPIRVGDRVKDDCEDLGTVVHIDGDRAWLRYDGHPDVLIDLRHLTRISEGQQ